MRQYRFFAAFWALALAGCGDAPVTQEPREVDPAIVAALNDQILVDPDLARQNEGSAALTGGIDHALPLPNDSIGAIDAARAEAIEIVGGRDRLLALPEPGTAAAAPLAVRLSVIARAREVGAPAPCVEALRHDFVWAARMPTEFPIYPRGATQEAAGTDSGDCALRAVNFRTPASSDEVLAFYHTLAREAGYSSRLATAGDERVLRGRRGGAAFAVAVRQGPAGTVAVDLVTRGDG
ncbi:hypothetical protein [Pelagerythrobacter sp.]|uniref:hypothetical protein n=1 Tax=Pelagerythrobacter sp. TaxID=2800702 RepID=UPI0035AF31E4